MVVIEKDKADAEEVQKSVAEEEEGARGTAADVQAIKDDAQRDLDKALPALEQAVQCLKRLKKEHINEVKGMANPPGGVKLCMEAVCIMFQIRPVKIADPNVPGKKLDDYWKAAQQEVLTNPAKLLENLMAYDRDNIPDSVITKIEPYINRDDFDPTAIRKASVACEAMCMWVRAMNIYHHVAKAVEPKRIALRTSEAELAVVQERLDGAQEALRKVNEKIEKLEYDSEMCEVKLVRAGKLIGGLGGEKQ